MSVRIQQILLHETNVAAVTDPLGGSYYVEALTANLVEKAWAFFEAIQNEGGFLASLDSGWLHARAHENQQADFVAQSTGDKVIVGTTHFREDVSPFEVDGFMGVSDAYEVALQRLHAVRATRDAARAGRALRALETVCRGTDNIMPAMLEALDAEVTLGEIGAVYREVFGDWTPPAIAVR
jgi:methylmalonyl-CoA mutase N-terminal domain/subunit